MGRLETAERWIKVVSPQVVPPSLKDNTGDADRFSRSVEKALGENPVFVGLPLIKRLPSLLRACGYRVSALLYKGSRSWHVMDVWPASASPPIYGLAVDLGTTTVVVRLIDLESGETRGETSFINPQTEIGLDILTRIHHRDGSGFAAGDVQTPRQHLSRQSDQSPPLRRGERKDLRHPRPGDLRGTECESGFHESLQRRKVHTPHGQIPFPHCPSSRLIASAILQRDAAIPPWFACSVDYFSSFSSEGLSVSVSSMSTLGMVPM